METSTSSAPHRVSVDATQLFTDESNEPEQFVGQHQDDTNKLLKKNWSAIKTFSLIRKYSRLYNIRVKENNIVKTLADSNIMAIFTNQIHKFKVNISLGFILVNNTNDTLRYFHASGNKDRLFDRPVLIENSVEFKEFIAQISDKDFIEHATRSRPDTSWTIHCITNLCFYVYPIQSHLMGCPTTLPLHVKNNKAIISNNTDSNGQAYTDNLCLFRALAQMKGKQSELAKATKQYFFQYLDAKRLDESLFNGLAMSDLTTVEQTFSVSIYVYHLELCGGETVAKLLRRSSKNYKDQLNLHAEDFHYCWIKNIRMYTKSYKCSFCSKLLKSATALKRHTESCSTTTKHSYPSGAYTIPKSIFEKLEAIGIHVDNSKRYYPYFAVFDCEAYFDTSNLPKDTATINWEVKHKIASISVSSNVAGHTDPICFVNDHNSEYDVVHRTMAHLEELSAICCERLQQRYASVFAELEKKKVLALKLEANAINTSGKSLLQKKFEKLEEELQSYLSDLLVFGFNSGAYDVPLMKTYMIQYLFKQGSDIQFVVKKGNNYMCLKTETLKFCDITNFLAPGYGYSDYLKAMEVDAEKFYWIYDKFTSLELLKQTTFPKYEDFYSSLKRKNISLVEYAKCKKIWDINNMKTLRDLLVYYNNEDCRGFVLAVEKQMAFFRSKHLDMKSAISMPGLAIQRLFQLKDPQAAILLFGEKNKDLYHLIRSGIRGGLSMVFNRYQHAEETKIKQEYFCEQAELTKSCHGFDVSGMYLSNLMQLQPTGSFVRRRKENNFVLEKTYTHGEKATEWLMHMEVVLDVKIQHMFNGGEIRVGGRNLPVDGYAEKSNEKIVLQYSGCYWHSHLCTDCSSGRYGDVLKDTENQLKTYEILNYFIQIGYKVYHTWACEFEKKKKEDKELEKFCNELKIVVDNRYKLSEKEIVEDVLSGKIFGMVECDIYTPDDLKPAFAEFQPIIKHAYITRDDIGDTMRKFAEKNDLLKRPTKTLLASYYGNKLLLATPLLQWYLKHGLKVTKVHQVIQYKPMQCFTKFGEEVMNARREGDKDQAKKIISDSCKLMGKYVKSMI